MKQTILPAFMLSLALRAHFAISQPIPVADELADMVEQVVSDTGISINIAQQTRTTIQIDKVNGVSVCATEARADVEKLQLAFEAHPNIFRNFGPVLVSVTALDGTKRRASVVDLQAQGVMDGCHAIYVSIHQ